MLGLFGYRLLLKTENWKYYSKIIFNCVNSVVGHIFNESFSRKEVCGSREQCMRPTQNAKRSRNYSFSFMFFLSSKWPPFQGIMSQESIVAHFYL